MRVASVSQKLKSTCFNVVILTNAFSLVAAQAACVHKLCIRYVSYNLFLKRFLQIKSIYLSIYLSLLVAGVVTIEQGVNASSFSGAQTVHPLSICLDLLLVGVATGGK